VRITFGVAVSLLALVLGAAGQSRGGGLRGGGFGVRAPGRGFSSAGRFDQRRGFWPWYGLGYADYSEPYYEAPPPQVFPPPFPELVAPVAVVQPKLIEVPGSVDKAPQPTQPTVLVFRNGQREDVKEYAMSGPYLYDYTKPRAARRISVDDLDLEATERANQQRGVQFLIPTSPSEVTVRF